MTATTAALLGLVQGLTEFIPVSSKTHLVVVPALFHLKHGSHYLEYIVLLHAGTLLALIIYFFGDLWRILNDIPSKGSEGRRLLGLLIVATVPAAVVGKIFETQIDDLLTKHPRTAAFALLATAAILVAAEWLSGGIGKRLARPLRERVETKDAILMGVAQAFALLPGISRSGSTMSTGLALGLKREVAARFAFLMAIPIIAGADLLELPKALSQGDHFTQLVGFLVSFASGFAAIAFLMRWLRSHSFLFFAAYCAVFAVAVGILLSR